MPAPAVQSAIKAAFCVYGRHVKKQEINIAAKHVRLPAAVFPCGSVLLPV